MSSKYVEWVPRRYTAPHATPCRLAHSPTCLPQVRRLDRACAGIEELRDAMRTGLRSAGLAELQALLAAPTRRARDAAGGAMKPSGPRLHYEYKPQAEATGG